MFTEDKHQLNAYQHLSPANSLSGGFKGRGERTHSLALKDAPALAGFPATGVAQEPLPHFFPARSPTGVPSSLPRKRKMWEFGFMFGAGLRKQT